MLSRGTGIFGFNPLLPHETIAEILLYLDLVSLVRVSQTTAMFFHFLESPNCNFIWRHARKTYSQPVISPLEEDGWTEGKWARWIFGGGTCMSCGSHTMNLPWSFALRLRACPTKMCNPYRHFNGPNSPMLLVCSSISQEAQKYREVLEWLPGHVQHSCYGPRNGGSPRWYFRIHLEWAMKYQLRKFDELGPERARQFFKQKATLRTTIEKQSKIMGRWIKMYKRRVDAVENFNHKRIRIFCERLKIRPSDISNSPTFMNTMSVLRNTQEKFTDKLFQSLRDRILSEVLDLQNERTKIRHASKSNIIAINQGQPPFLSGNVYKCLRCVKVYAQYLESQSIVQPLSDHYSSKAHARGKGKNGVRGKKKRELRAAGDTAPRKGPPFIRRAHKIFNWSGLTSHLASIHQHRGPRIDVDYILSTQEDGELAEIEAEGGWLVPVELDDQSNGV